MKQIEKIFYSKFTSLCTGILCIYTYNLIESMKKIFWNYWGSTFYVIHRLCPHGNNIPWGCQGTVLKSRSCSALSKIYDLRSCFPILFTFLKMFWRLNTITNELTIRKAIVRFHVLATVFSTINCVYINVTYLA